MGVAWACVMVRDAPYQVIQYLSEIKKYPPLDPREERALLRQIGKKGSQKAFKTLVERNLRFVVSVAIKYRNGGLTLPELINEGNLGLMEAIKRFEPSNYSSRFLSYAVWWIRQKINQAIQEKSRLVRISADLEGKKTRLAKYTSDSLQKFGEIKMDYIARKAGCTVKVVEIMLSVNKNTSSLDRPLSFSKSGQVNLHELIPIKGSIDPFEHFHREAQEKIILDLCAELTPKERRVVDYYYGAGLGGSTLTLLKIGQIFGVTLERIRQIKEQALEKMKTRAHILGYRPYLVKNMYFS